MIDNSGAFSIEKGNKEKIKEKSSKNIEYERKQENPSVDKFLNRKPSSANLLNL